MTQSKCGATLMIGVELAEPDDELDEPGEHHCIRQREHAPPRLCWCGWGFENGRATQWYSGERELATPGSARRRLARRARMP
jgi:hypothetical protein